MSTSRQAAAVELIRRMDLTRTLQRAGKPLTNTDMHSTGEAARAYAKASGKRRNRRGR